MRRLALASILVLGVFLLAQSASAQLVYGVWGDGSAFTPSDLDTYNPGSFTGDVTIDDSGSAPVLVEANFQTKTEQVFGGTATCCLGTTVRTLAIGTLSVEGLPVTGTGTTSTSVNWGTVTGYTQEPFPVSSLRCKTTAGPGCGGCSSCSEVGLSEGFGPTPPLKDSEFNSDPWVFGSDRKSFTAASIEIVNIFGGMITAWGQAKGSIPSLVPAVPLLGLGLLGVGFLGVGARVLRRPKD